MSFGHLQTPVSQLLWQLDEKNVSVGCNISKWLWEKKMRCGYPLKLLCQQSDQAIAL